MARFAEVRRGPAWTTRSAERFVRTWKMEHPCCDCSEREGRPVFYAYYQLEFDHVPGTKRYCLGHNKIVRGLTEEELRKEISNCDLLCSNCHREREHRRRHGYNDASIPRGLGSGVIRAGGPGNT